MKTNPAALMLPPTGSSTNDIRPITSPVAIPTAWTWLGWLLLVLVLAGLACLLWRWWRKRAVTGALPPQIPPHAKARKKLEEALAWINEPKPFCVLVSDTLRLYLEERFVFHAPERTTEEFLIELRDTDRLTIEQKNTLGEFLRQCDLVKFAQYEPVQTELRSLHAIAVRLVNDTEPPPPRPDPAGPPIPAQAT
jgi:hypothetical protein